MSNRTGAPGQAIAAAGGAGLALSLWLPWYTIQIPQSALDSVSQTSQQFGAVGQLIRSGAELISHLGPFHITAWQAFTTAPAVLLAAAIIGGGLALLALTDRAGSTSQVTMLAGAVGVVLAGYRIAVPPGQGDFVHPAWGLYLAVVSSLAMLIGGALAARDRMSVDSAPAAAYASQLPVAAPAEGWATAVAATGPALGGSPEGWSPAHSVPPPAP